jgi:hypothetical protein
LPRRAGSGSRGRTSGSPGDEEGEAKRRTIVQELEQRAGVRDTQGLVGFGTALGNGVTCGGHGWRAMKIIELKISDEDPATGLGCSSDVSGYQDQEDALSGHAKKKAKAGDATCDMRHAT